MQSLDDFLEQWSNDNDFIEAHTSGSTGVPKPICLLKKDMESSASATNRFFHLGEGSVFVCPLSLDYIAGKMMAVRAMLAHGELKIIPPSNKFDLPDGVIDLLAIVPSMVDSLHNASDLTRIRNIIIGGAALDSQRRQWLMDNDVNAFETYGMTETCSHVALKHVTDEDFKALPGFTFSTDERQCLVINSTTMSFKRLTTNDIIDLKDNTTFRWLGRADNAINSGGIKIFAEQVEHEMHQILKQANIDTSEFEFYVTRRSDARWGEVPVMVTTASPSIAATILTLIKSQTDHKCLPQDVIVVTSIQHTSSGKIKRLPLP